MWGAGHAAGQQFADCVPAANRLDFSANGHSSRLESNVTDTASHAEGTKATEAPGRPPIVVTHEGGVRFAAQVRSHVVHVDQPVRAGGADTAPMPLELLGVSLGTCIAYYVQQFLLARNLPSEGMRVEVEQHGAKNPYRVGEFAVRVELASPLSPAYREAMDRVVKSCPAHHTLELPTPVRVEIITPDAATS